MVSPKALLPQGIEAFSLPLAAPPLRLVAQPLRFAAGTLSETIFIFYAAGCFFREPGAGPVRIFSNYRNRFLVIGTVENQRIATGLIGDPVPLRIFRGRAMKVNRLPTSLSKLQRFSMCVTRRLRQVIWHG